MPGAPRKSVSKVEPTVVESEVVADEVDDAFDLLSVLDTEDLPPVPVKLKDAKFDIRRSYSGEESIQFGAYLRADQIELAMKLIAGDEGGSAIARHLGDCSIEQAVKLINKLGNISTLTSGEALALLPASLRGMDGALPSQDANATTVEASAKS
ncbi:MULTISPECIES: hypothetical protein [unclassified Rhodococcus (in: high G+C Gram-positive bacteria)]|uniref:hypothetical protein n=1 Tax=unclassified Rhodococcus (in: high G+C Gram-positive bacteria) TaxID=192944 RepID=UPI0023E1604B|nr:MULTISPECIES: hypothetical protein [unclassified Rhodococcus (in: high G+C Gram-positive bacteria)]MDF3316476.1 hypothetical protein [Rhodococcus sp. C3V]WEX03805.1 hypothetical protein P0M12_30075 [Rhodococcus sp. RCBS9]WEX03883.1 hypothetical protein P0M12_00085 [Rhodococcus sp. RCBS9]